VGLGEGEVAGGLVFEGETNVVVEGAH
jgi:hypothetical protein